jgi:hypothetical protein
MRHELQSRVRALEEELDAAVAKAAHLGLASVAAHEALYTPLLKLC